MIDDSGYFSNLDITKITNKYESNPAEYNKITPDTLSLTNMAILEAKKDWGDRKLSALEIEERIYIASEKMPSQDNVIVNLRKAYQAIKKEYELFTNLEKEKIVSFGGLHVIGTERHESRRIDNQLRGRAGRQGDPGSNRFFLSLDDSLFRAFGGEKLQGMMSEYNMDELPIESKLLCKSLDEAQKKIENFFFDIRKNLFDFDQVLNTQRERVYAERKLALTADDISEKICEYIEKTMDEIVEVNLRDVATKRVAEWPMEKLVIKIRQFCCLLDDLTAEALLTQCGGNRPMESLQAYLRQRGVEAYFNKRATVETISPGLMVSAERYFILQQTDTLWKEHLKAIKFLQQAVYLRGYASRDPLTEYKLEGYNLFFDMMAQIRRNVIFNIYSFQPAKLKS